MRISIIGTGYVGLVSGVCLAHVGHDVVCVDLDAEKVERLNRGVAPIHEDGLDELLADVVGSRFRATTDLSEAVEASEVTIIAVGTPFGEDRIDLQQIEAAAEQLGAALAGSETYHVVAVKSTVVPGTTQDVVGPALERASGRRIGAELGLGMNPEFLREGVAVRDFLEPDRIVLGGVDERTLDVLAAIYRPFHDATIVRVDPRTAEMTKYAANALLALLISFSNEIGNLSAALGVDGTDVLRGVHLDRRWSPVVDGMRIEPEILRYLAVGCGFGGSCFPKDVRALLAHGESAGVPMRILRAALDVNEDQAGVLLDRLRSGIELAGARVAVLGAAFKPHTDDVRESPTLRIVPALIEAGADVVVHDPVASENARAVLGDAVACSDDLAAVLEGADAVLLVTAWPEYARVPALLDGRRVTVVDGRRMFESASVAEYDGIGLPLRARDAV